MFITTKQILAQNRVVPAFNFSTAEVARAVVGVCEEQDQDVILQTSVSEAKFLGLGVAVGIAQALGEKSKIFVSLHLDHGDDLEVIKMALNSGYTSFLVGGSKVSLEFAESVKFVSEAKKLTGEDVVVEAALYDFDRAVDFVEKTRPDLLAPFSVVGSEDKTEIDKLTHVRKFVNTPLVLHDGSSKSNEEIKRAVAAGVVKINFNTCLREAWAKELRETLRTSPNEIKPYKILEPSVGAVGEVVEEKVRLLKFETRP